ncbi:hypothetical protein ACFYKX_15670 [Cytobacillus sp. FJAT-54145]|uniref:Uncharacterized protein n=1 Tax=Cytobacillus spartinae TaxID=3299023 RepID=A0ABW6KFQ0_9BACI
MRALIANKLTTIWSEVQKQITDKRMEDCHKDPLLEQKLFLLKHYPAYLHEYSLLVKRMLDSAFIKEPISIMSFRNGSAIDYDAFYALIEEEGKGPFFYTGIEPNLWTDHNGVPVNSLSWIWTNLTELQELNTEGQNVFIFPKSLSVMSYQEIEALKRLIQTGRFKRDHICIAFSAIDMKTKTFERNRFETIVQTFLKWQKYKIQKQIVLQPKKDSGVEDKGFEYPAKLYSYMDEHPFTKKWLPEKCVSYYSELVFLKK